MLEGTWEAVYADGSRVAEHDATHPAAREGQVPYTAADWNAAIAVTFRSSVAETTIPLGPLAPGTSRSLRSRVFMNAVHGAALRFYLVVISLAGEAVDATTSCAVIYWSPTGEVCVSPHFDSPTVAQYASRLLSGHEVALPQSEYADPSPSEAT